MVTGVTGWGLGLKRKDHPWASDKMFPIKEKEKNWFQFFI